MTTDPIPARNAALTELLTAVKSESEQLRADVQNSEAERKRANKLNRVLLVLAIVLLLVLGGAVWQVYRLASEVKDTNATIADCSTVGGKCYEESRKRLSGAIGSIAQISVFVSQCGRLWPGESGAEYDAKLAKCVDERIKAAQDAAGAQPAPAPSGSRTPR